MDRGGSGGGGLCSMRHNALLFLVASCMGPIISQLKFDRLQIIRTKEEPIEGRGGELNVLI